MAENTQKYLLSLKSLKWAQVSCIPLFQGILPLRFIGFLHGVEQYSKNLGLVKKSDPQCEQHTNKPYLFFI